MPALEFTCSFEKGTLICLRQFFQFGSHKAHRRYTRGTHNVYDSGDNLKFQGAIPPNDTSINGTTFISTKMPRFKPPTAHEPPRSENSREEGSHIRESKLRTTLQKSRPEEFY